MSIKHDHTLNPVTALDFYSASSGQLLLLAGEGCCLKIFDASTSILLRQCRIFEDQGIHGISSRQNDDLVEDDSGFGVVIWGGSSLCVFTSKDFTRLLTRGAPSHTTNGLEELSDQCLRETSSVVSDWVLDAVIAPSGQECVLVTAHNTVLRARLVNNFQRIALESLGSPVRSILYSAQLVWESESTVLVAAGTVFGEIIFWQCSVSEIPNCSGSRILHTFTGHEGSVFGVNISPILVDRNGKPSRLLASCSDDRTIRLWELNLPPKTDGQLSEAIAVQDRNFGDHGDKGMTSSECLTMMMGHASRIWGVQLIFRNPDVSVLSFGEDATTQHWALEDWGYIEFRAEADTISGHVKQARLTHLGTYGFHSGKQIWSRAIHGSQPPIIATGGADGNISTYQIPLPNAEIRAIGDQLPQRGDTGTVQHVMHTKSWDLDEILKDLPSTSSPSIEMGGASTSEPPTHDADTLSNTSSCPSPLDEKNGSKLPKKPNWTKMKASKDIFHKYAFVSENQVLATTTFGRVFLGEISPCVQWTEVSRSRSDDLKFYSIVEGVSVVEIAFLGCANGTIFLYRAGLIKDFGRVSGKVADMFAMYDPESGKVDLLVTTLGGKFVTLFKLDRDTNGAIGSSKENGKLQEVRYQLPDRFIVTSAGKLSNVLLALGSRHGVLAIYNLKKYDGSICNWTPNVHSGDAITSIVNLPNSMKDSKLHFVTTGRDGSYSIFCLTGSKVNLLHRGTPPFGPMIEKAWFAGSDLVLCGFKSKNFIVWNETKQCEISSVECGGARRSYAYSPSGKDGAGNFIYTKASKLYLHSQRQPSHQIIKPGGHGREIKTAAVSPDGLIATGAEDTVIRIWKYPDSPLTTEKHFECLAVVEKHTTGIQRLQWHGTHYLFSSGGNEEFFVWAVESIPGFGIGVVFEASCPDQSKEKDLRIMSFDVSSLSAFQDDCDRFLISLAYSDSTIRVYTYSKDQGFRLVVGGRYTSSCLTQLQHREVRGHELFMLTAATDGYLTVWKTTLSRQDGDRMSELVMLSNHLVHQSSIKALDIFTKDGRFVVATGGDDNALGITIYQAGDLDQKPQRVIVRSAHAAAITGLSFIGNDRELRIVTSSNDQRVKDWSLTLGKSDPLEGLELRKTGDVFTSVADVGDVTTLTGGAGKANKVLLVGNGMEVYEVAC